MTADELQAWLRGHLELIFAFMEYEVTLSSEADLHINLREYWFRDADWNEPGYRFVPLGHDGTGGEVALWIRPEHDGPSPVVFFGSEGGTGVLSSSPTAWAQVLAHAPVIAEYPEGEPDNSARLFADGNECLERAEARSSLATYRAAVIERFGPLPAFEQLVGVGEVDESEFRAWVIRVVSRTESREVEEKRLAADAQWQAQHAKALAFAQMCAGMLPSERESLKDGARYDGECPSCGNESRLRLVRYEEMAFGLCLKCYFSAAW